MCRVSANPAKRPIPTQKQNSSEDLVTAPSDRSLFPHTAQDGREHLEPTCLVLMNIQSKPLDGWFSKDPTTRACCFSHHVLITIIPAASVCKTGLG